MSYTHLTADERFSIAHMHMAKFSMRLMAQRINRSPSTISREVRRNKGDYSPYWYDWAQMYAEQCKAQPTCEKRKSHRPLYDLVVHNLREGLSPEIIAGRLKREYRSLKMNVSHETIYQ